MTEKIYGPYLRKDGRKHVIRISFGPDGKETGRRTQSYPRYLIEQSSNLNIPDDLTVDHINRDKTDDRINNYRLLPLKEHLRDDAVYRRSPSALCKGCGKAFELSRHQTSERAKNLPGPFCSRSCASRKSNATSLSVETRPLPEYFRRDK